MLQKLRKAVVTFGWDGQKRLSGEMGFDLGPESQENLVRNWTKRRTFHIPYRWIYMNKSLEKSKGCLREKEE